MNAFTASPWRLVRADALETEAEALEQAANTLNGVIGLSDKVEFPVLTAAFNTLIRLRDRNRENAAKLRAAA